MWYDVLSLMICMLYYLNNGVYWQLGLANVCNFIPLFTCLDIVVIYQVPCDYKGSAARMYVSDMILFYHYHVLYDI